MPGNEFGDRVHNFFGPDNLSQGQHQSHVLQQGNWPVLNSNIWVNGQMQVDVPNSSNNNYSSQNSDINRRQTSYSVNAVNGLNFSRSDLGPDYCKSPPLNEQPYANGFMYGDQIYRNRHNESNFMPANANPGQHDLIASRGLPAHVLQQGYGPEQQAKASGRLETSIPSVGFDLFSSQQQLNHQQARMMQAIQHQQPGLNDMQHLQQQLVLRKMQDFQRLQQSGLRTQDLMNQASPLNINASGHQSTLVTSTPNQDTLHEPGTNWLSSSSSMQVSPSGPVFPTNVGQTQRPTDLAPQHVDQFLYGVPVSSSRGLSVNHYSQMEIDGSSLSQMPTSSHSQLKFLPDQNGAQEGIFGSSKKIQTENIFGHSSSQLLSSGMRDSAALQHSNFMERNLPQQDSRARQGLETISESLHERPLQQVPSSRNEVALDPTEEKILYGSDDNIWDVLGNGSNMSGEAGNLFDNGGISNGLQSNQSGIWSALMQSAVAETTSNDLGPQEWSGMTSHNTECYPPNQVPIVRNDNVERASFPNDTAQIPAALSSAPVPPSTDNFMVLNQLGHGFQRMPVQRVPADTPQLFGQSLDEANKHSNPITRQGSIAKGSQMHGIATQHSLNAERNAQTMSASWAPRHGGPIEQNGLNALTGVSRGDRLSNIHENAKTQNSQDNQSRVIQGDATPGNSFWKSNSVLSSNDFGSMVENHQSNKGGLSLNDAASSEEKPCNAGVGHEPSSFTSNNFFLNQWKAAQPSVKFQGDERLGRMLDEVNGHNQGSASLSGYVKNGVTMQDMENHPKENSSDSHHSSLSQRASAGHRENRLSDAIDSRSSAHGKQKLTNQLFMKDSVHRKFRYHPMGNLNDNEEPTFGPKQPSQVQEVLQKDTGPYGSCTSNKASLQGQNMLELFQKLDNSGNHLAPSHLSSESSLLAQPRTTDKSDGSAGGFQLAQSSVSQGFGLELGPPSLQLQTVELPSSSPNSQGMIDSMRTCDAGAEMEGKGTSRVPSASLQSVHFPIFESQVEFKNGRSAGLGHHGHENPMYKMRRNYNTAFASDIPSARNQLHNEQVKSEKTPFNHNLDSSSSNNTPQFMQGGVAETVLPDSLHQIQKDDSTFRSMNNVKDGTAAPVSLMMDQIRKSQHMGDHGNSPWGSSQGLDSMLTKVQALQKTSAIQNPKAPMLFAELSKSNSLGSSSQGDLNIGNEAENMDLDPKLVKSLGKASSVRNHQDEYPGNSATQKDIQAFGRSLKPNNLSNEGPALINQTLKALRDAESDPSVRDSKRIKGSDNDLDGQVNLMSGPIIEVGVGNSLGLNQGVPSGGFGTLSGTPSDSLQKNTSPHGNVTSRDMLVPGLGASESHPSTNCATSVGPECQISPQMAPSWFNKYGNFKNGQMLPVSNPHNTQLVPSKPAGSPFILGKPSSVVDALNSQEKSASTHVPVDSSQVGGVLLKSASTSVANEQLLCPQPLELNVTPEHQLIARPIKRETATSELHPWHNEISDGSKFISTLSVAEAGWSKASNRLTEKVEDYTDLIEDGHPVSRMKRRLILTTQLTQQLFSPPPAIILSSYASSNYESVTYAVSRLALGDACSSDSFSRDSRLPPDGVNRQSAKRKLNGDLQFAKAIEELLGKKKNLENNFSRLDKRASILDLRVELQDLEKYSLINRFAKFHGRGQNDSAETPSSNATTERSNVQRYVTALAMPRNIPDRVQYLSL